MLSYGKVGQKEKNVEIPRFYLKIAQKQPKIGLFHKQKVIIRVKTSHQQMWIESLNFPRRKFFNDRLKNHSKNSTPTNVDRTLFFHIPIHVCGDCDHHVTFSNPSNPRLWCWLSIFAHFCPLCPLSYTKLFAKNAQK